MKILKFKKTGTLKRESTKKCFLFSEESITIKKDHQM